jgi:hypothetical protein
MVNAEATSDFPQLKPGASEIIQQWSMQLHVFNRVALLLPLLKLALAAALKSGAASPDLALAYGGRSMWVFPPFLMRGLAAYGIVIVWLYRQLHRRSPREFEALLWQAPIAHIAVSTALLGALVLAHGDAAAFVNEHTGSIGLSLAAHLAIGYGYVGLIVLARNTLRANGYFVDGEPRVDVSDDSEQAFSTGNG